MDEALTPTGAVEHIVFRMQENISNLRASHLAMDMALPLGEVLPDAVDAPSLLRLALVGSGKAADAIAAIALAARMRISTEEDEQGWTEAATAPRLTEADKDDLLAEMEAERAMMTEADRAAGQALGVLRMDWPHVADAAASIALTSPEHHVAILARLLAYAEDEADLLMIGSNWLCGAARDDDGSGRGDDDDAPDPEPGPRPPGIGRRLRQRECA